MDDKSELVDLAKEMLKKSYAPYSKFNVGAAIKTKSGQIYKGVNIENLSYSVTVCAERVAIFSAIADGHQEFSSIAIAANDTATITPCGACRQVLSEFVGSDFPIMLINSNDEIVHLVFKDIFPNPFVPDKDFSA